MSQFVYPPITSGDQIDRYRKSVILAFYNNELRNGQSAMSLETAYEMTLKAADDNELLFEIYQKYMNQAQDDNTDHSMQEEEKFMRIAANAIQSQQKQQISTHRSLMSQLMNDDSSSSKDSESDYTDDDDDES